MYYICRQEVGGVLLHVVENTFFEIRLQGSENCSNYLSLSLPCCPREGINPRELMPPFTILAARLFLSPPTNAPKTKNHDRDELCKTKVILYKSSGEQFLDLGALVGGLRKSLAAKMVNGGISLRELMPSQGQYGR